jgi:antitoxin VapB
MKDEPRKRGSGAWIRDQLMRGEDANKTDKQLAEEARQKFGGSTGPKDVAWNRYQLRRQGKLPPSPRGGKVAVAKVFMHGRSQAVRLPKAFRLACDEVRVRRVEGGGILLEPMTTDVDAWFAALDRLTNPSFMEEGRDQPPMPETEDRFD